MIGGFKFDNIMFIVSYALSTQPLLLSFFLCVFLCINNKDRVYVEVETILIVERKKFFILISII